MAALKTLGDWLADSGWTAAIADANIASSGVADSILAASHLSRTRHALEVTACSLHIIMKKAYTHYVERENRMEMISFEDWKISRIASSPQLQYWSITLDFELAVLIFVQSICCGNFALYKDALSKIIPWFFALNHTNYAHWLPVHLRDVMQLAMKHPNLESEFEAGHFVVHKTQCVHSGIAIFFLTMLMSRTTNVSREMGVPLVWQRTRLSCFDGW